MAGCGGVEQSRRPIARHPFRIRAGRNCAFNIAAAMDRASLYGWIDGKTQSQVCVSQRRDSCDACSEAFYCVPLRAESVISAALRVVAPRGWLASKERTRRVAGREKLGAGTSRPRATGAAARQPRRTGFAGVNARAQV